MPKEYLDTEELLEVFPYSKRMLEKFIAEEILIEGVHFRRPAGPRTKRVFFWSAIEKWMHGQDFDLRVKQIERTQARERASN